MKVEHFNDVQHWRWRAAELRVIADQMEHPYSKEQILLIADDYEKLADRAQRRLDQEHS